MMRRHYAAVLAPIAGSLLIAQPGPAFTEPAPPPMSIEVAALARNQSGVGYVVTVHNRLDAARQVEVTQRFAQTAARAAASDAGQLQPEGVTWVIDVPPRQSRAVNSDISFDGSFTSRSTACVRDLQTLRTLDCAAGDLAVGATEAGTGLQRTPLLLLVMLALLLTGAGYRPLPRRLRRLWAPDMKGRPWAPDMKGRPWKTDAKAWRWAPDVKVGRWAPGVQGQRRAPDLKGFVARHRHALVAGGALLAVLTISAAGLLYLTGRARSAINLQERPGRAIGWSGEQVQAAFGVPTRSNNVEFTIYRWVCVELDTGPQCTTTVAIRNISNTPRQWFTRMQRLQYADESWVEADPNLTLVANGSNDQFATPLAAGERRIAVLVYRPAPDKALSRLELRDGAFSRGVAFPIG